MLNYKVLLVHSHVDFFQVIVYSVRMSNYLTYFFIPSLQTIDPKKKTVLLNVHAFSLNLSLVWIYILPYYNSDNFQYCYIRMERYHVKLPWKVV
jgi:hypothetical protein